MAVKVWQNIQTSLKLTRRTVPGRSTRFPSCQPDCRRSSSCLGRRSRLRLRHRVSRRHGGRRVRQDGAGVEGLKEEGEVALASQRHRHTWSNSHDVGHADRCMWSCPAEAAMVTSGWRCPRFPPSFALSGDSSFLKITQVE